MKNIQAKHSIKDIRAEFKKAGVFYTPESLAKYMLSFANQEKLKDITVYDPTCGIGNLLNIFDNDIKKYGQEIDRFSFEEANKKLKSFNGFCGNTLEDPFFLDKKFDLIMANPPFSISYDDNKINTDDVRFNQCGILPPKSKADYLFILHCLHYLKDTGVAIILVFPGVLYRGNREGKIRQWLIENNYIDTVVQIGGKQFEDTPIAPALLVLKKNKNTTDILFIDSEKDKKERIPFDEVKQNDFNLSVNLYIQNEENKIIINPFETELQARDEIKKQLQKDIAFSYFVWKIEKDNRFNVLNFIDDLIFLLKNEKKKIVKEMGV